MRRSILIIQGHPDPHGSHLCHALAEAYARGALAAGHSVSRVEVASLDFPLMRTQADFETGSMPHDLLPARDALLEAHHVVLLFPLWLGTMPALLKGFLEQLMRPGFAFVQAGPGFPQKLLGGRSARVIVTMGMPSLMYRWYFFAHGVLGLERNILDFVGISPVRHSLFGMVEAAGAEQRAGWLREMERLGRAAR
ncbi:NAD(P)H-dependent oxidoreductase [Xanthobacter sp. DSM 24535]|uniref:NAD(P)H-dependent oxidoreductase n=1 Tax=Roseixanthobacter psychrophilus TaxID=3119917 RepID=UPI00372A7D55